MLSQIVLGVVQGIFEWIPVSSEGLVALLSKFFFQSSRPLQMALFLHLGTLFAALIYFRKDWKEIILLKDKKTLKFLIISTLISLLIGFPLYKFVNSITLGASLLLLTGLGLFATSYFHKSKKRNSLSENSLALFSGLLQGFSVIPGLSRSGVTIFGLSFGRENPKEILKLSYLMSVPVGIASSLYLILEDGGIILDAWLGLLISFAVGIFALKLIFKFIKRVNFSKFTFLFGVICVLGALISFLS